ncbi:M24 family metallopeptidase [Agrobacterium tumefaciens]|uniref:M24 family metallopeptidase n=1 Tax=Agrobacterium tumefaciens TaxID=358 RepID=UPI001574D2BD|nr:aminopeptidase P family protein [Agrobacterium tumefaciens]
MLMNDDRIKRMLLSNNLAAVIATAPENVLYTSGFWCLPQWIRRGPQAFVLLNAELAYSSVVITSTSTLDLVADQQVPGRVRRYGTFTVDIDSSVALDAVSLRQAQLQALPDEGGAIPALVAEIRDARLTKASIGIDEIGLLPDDIEKLRTALPDVEWVMATSLLRSVRAVKTVEEINMLRTVGQITERSVTAALSVAKVGATEIDVARAFHTRTVQEDGVPVLGCIGFGERSALMNVQPSTRALRKGDVIRFDVGGHYHHYRADIARIACFGEPSPDIRLKYDALNKGVQRGIDNIRSGVPASEIFRIVVETVREEGIPHYQRSHVGHGIGLDGYDMPLLSASSTDVLEAGMVLCIETPYYELGRVGLQVEDMLVVREDGAEMLTNAGDQLMVLN